MSLQEYCCHGTAINGELDQPCLLCEVDSLEQQVAALTKERDELGGELMEFFGAPVSRSLKDQLAAAQAEVARLTLELDEAGSNCSMYKQQVLNAQADNARLRGVMQHSHDYGYVREIQAEALALPTDDSALQERLKEEREKVIQAAVSLGAFTPKSPVANQLRSMT